MIAHETHEAHEWKFEIMGQRTLSERGVFGEIGRAFNALAREVKALRPVQSPNILTGRTRDGVTRQPTAVAGTGSTVQPADVWLA